MAVNIWYSYSNLFCITYYVCFTSMGYTRWYIMLIFGKSKNDWKALELYYRREWLSFVAGLIIGIIIGVIL